MPIVFQQFQVCLFLLYHDNLWSSSIVVQGGSCFKLDGSHFEGKNIINEGMGAAVSIAGGNHSGDSSKGNNAAECKKLFDEKERLDDLFQEIALSMDFSDVETDAKDKDRISLVNLLNYHSKENNHLFSKVVKNPSILHEAHHFACKKRDVNNFKNQLPRKRFKLLLCCIFYFSRLWDIFQGANKDENAHNDKVEVIVDKASPENEVGINGDSTEVELNITRIDKKDKYVKIGYLVEAIKCVEVVMDTTVANLEKDLMNIDKVV